jgi:hypothetical protein
VETKSTTHGQHKSRMSWTLHLILPPTSTLAGEGINRRTYTPFREEIGAGPHEVKKFSEDLKQIMCLECKKVVFRMEGSLVSAVDGWRHLNDLPILKWLGKKKEEVSQLNIIFIIWRWKMAALEDRVTSSRLSYLLFARRRLFCCTRVLQWVITLQWCPLRIPTLMTRWKRFDPFSTFQNG